VGNQQVNQNGAAIKEPEHLAKAKAMPEGLSPVSRSHGVEKRPIADGGFRATMHEDHFHHGRKVLDHHRPVDASRTQ
tara:strand:- start:601 stop:831 length:231 start_codon:yes stop_codon:yes gene_type:complete